MKSLLIIFLFIFFFFFPSPVSAQIYTTDKLITVDRGKQMLYAWEGGSVINQTKVSTGMRYATTPAGQFSIRWKLPLQNMKGNHWYYGPYSIKNVPNVMYFYQDYAIHGTYWHNSFGWRASHGCVNVPVEFSKWLYDWAPFGTKVIIW